MSQPAPVVQRKDEQRGMVHRQAGLVGSTQTAMQREQVVENFIRI
jgi:hypothetical protein